MEITETTCPYCNGEIRPGQAVILIKLEANRYVTGHFVCPKELKAISSQPKKLK